MQFAVRYWSSLLPKEYREADGSPRLVDYSIHPASKLGLHNALLSLHDRIEILENHGAPYECAVFVVEENRVQKLTEDMAIDLFKALPSGEVKWIDIRKFLLPSQREGDQPPGSYHSSQQLTLFEHIHTPYDDLEIVPHKLDIDA